MNLSVGDLGADILPVSQLTLYGNVRKGHRPSFTEAARPAVAEPLYEYVKYRLSRELGYPVAGGSFGASMQVSPVNDGPVTIWMECRLEKTQNSRVSQTEIRQGYRPSILMSPVPQNNF